MIKKNVKHRYILVEQYICFTTLDCAVTHFTDTMIIKFKPLLTAAVEGITNIMATTSSAMVADHRH